MRVLTAALALILFAARLAPAQSAAEQILLGDRDRAALNSTGALKHYQQAIAQDSMNSEALWKAAGEAVDLGEAAGFADAARTRDSLYKLGEQYATRAVQANPNSASAHFTLSRALGRAALAVGPRDRVNYAKQVRTEALATLAIDSLQDGALHVMGMWNAEVMRLNGVVRFIAKHLLGGQIFGEANWDNAKRYLERAVAIRPDRIVHHLDLAGVYADLNDTARAREQYTLAIQLPPLEYNDKHYQQQAEDRLRNLR